MKKVAIKVVKEVKVDGRKNNTGRPVNTKSARQIRLNKQAQTKAAMDYVMQGGWFKLTEIVQVHMCMYQIKKVIVMVI